MNRTAIILLGCAVVSACQEPSAPPGVADGLQLEIVDASHNDGNEHFHFEPPIVAEPAPNGTFDASLLDHLTVRICELTGSDCVLPAVVEYTSAAGSGSEVLRVVPEDEHYIVNWHTDEFELDPERLYRILVLAAGTELGHADVDVVQTGADLKNVDTGESIPLKDVRTLPIKFRIEEGAVYVIGPDGGLFTTPDGDVSLTVPAGALDAFVGITVFPFTSIPDEVGLISGSVFEFGPEGTAFDLRATLTLAYEESSLPVGLDEIGLTLVSELPDGDWDEVDPNVVVVDPAANTVTGQIEGFSGKGIGERVEAVEVTPSAVTLEMGGTTQLEAILTGRSGREFIRRVRWTTGNPSVAEVDATGFVQAIDRGVTEITARSGDASDFATVTVRAPISVLIDASKSGGGWWFPQVPPFDPNETHQGEGFTANLRSLGFEVIEQTPPFDITIDALIPHDLVVRPSAETGTSYTETERAAYTQYVQNGGSLLLISDFHRAGSDPLSEAFGVTCEGITQPLHPLMNFIQDPITDGVLSGVLRYVAGCGITAAPAGAKILATADAGFLDLNDNGVQDMGEPSIPDLMVRFSFGSGLVVLIGDVNVIENGGSPNNAVPYDPPQPLTDNILRALLPPGSL